MSQEPDECELPLSYELDELPCELPESCDECDVPDDVPQSSDRLGGGVWTGAYKAASLAAS